MVLLVATGLLGCAQVNQLTPALPLQHISFDSLYVSIKNNDTISHSFYPLTVFDQPDDYHFLDKQNIYSRLTATGSKIGALNELLRIIKSPAFINFWFDSKDNNLNGTTLQSLVEKRYSTIGFPLGSAAYKCGNFRMYCIRTLIDAGIFEPADIRIVSTPYHQLAEFNIDGKWVGFDADPGEAYAINTFPDGTYMSFADVVQHPEYLKKYVWYLNPYDSLLLRPDAVVEEYLAKLDSMNYWPVNEMEVVDISGKWNLCPGSELLWSYTLPRLVDTTAAENQLMFDSTKNAIAQNDFMLAGDIMAHWLGYSSADKVIAEFEQGKILFTNGTLPNLQRSYCYQNNELVLRVTTGNLPVVLGKDLALPMVISSINTTNPITIGDTVFPAGYSRMVRYNKKDFQDFETRDEEPQQESSQFQYLAAGTIPPNTIAEFRLMYNQLIYPFLSGLQVETFGDSAANLTVTTGSTLTTDIPALQGYTTSTLPDGQYTIDGRAFNGLVDAGTGVYIEKKNGTIRKVRVVR